MLGFKILCVDEAQFLQKKKELADLVRKRHHEQYLKTGTTHIQQVIIFLLIISNVLILNSNSGQI